MSNKTLSTLNVVFMVVLVALGIAIWFTASQVLSIVFAVVLLLLALNITGVLGSLFGKD